MDEGKIGKLFHLGITLILFHNSIKAIINTTIC